MRVGLPLALIDLVSPDTDLTPDCGKTSASRQTFVTGTAAAARRAALRRMLLRLANAGEDATLELAGGRLLVRESAVIRAVDLAQLPRDAHGYVLCAEETFDPPTSPLDANGQGMPYAVYGYGAHLAEVEVDMRLGTVKVMRIVAAHDVGRAINPILVEGQIEGGVAQGIGMALMEEFTPGPRREPARLPDPHHRRRAADRIDPRRMRLLRRALRRQGHRRAGADPHRPRHPQRHPPCHGRAHHAHAGHARQGAGRHQGSCPSMSRMQAQHACRWPQAAPS